MAIGGFTEGIVLQAKTITVASANTLALETAEEENTGSGTPQKLKDLYDAYLIDGTSYIQTIKLPRTVKKGRVLYFRQKAGTNYGVIQQYNGDALVSLVSGVLNVAVIFNGTTWDLLQTT